MPTLQFDPDTTWSVFTMPPNVTMTSSQMYSTSPTYDSMGVEIQKAQKVIKAPPDDPEKILMRDTISVLERQIGSLRDASKKTISLPVTVRDFNKYLKVLGSPMKLSETDRDAVSRFLDEIWKYIHEDVKDDLAE